MSGVGSHRHVFSLQLPHARVGAPADRDALAWRVVLSVPIRCITATLQKTPPPVHSLSRASSGTANAAKNLREFRLRITHSVKETAMPKKETIERANRDKRQGKSPSIQAGEFVREEIDEIRQGRHGARSTKQAIAIGLSKARRAGVKLPPPKKGSTSEKTRRSAERAYAAGQNHRGHHANPRRSRATTRVLKREGHEAASPESLSRQARTQAAARSSTERSAIGRQDAPGPSKPCRAEPNCPQGSPYASNA